MNKSEYKSIDTNSLRLFLAVYDTGSLTGAAKILGVNQSTASHGLQKLRKIFDDQLFVKSGRGIVPTDRVIELIPRIRKLLPELTCLLQTQSFDPAEDTKPIVIGTNGCGRLVITQQIFGAEGMNGLSLKFVNVGTGRNVENILSNNKADVVIVISNNKSSIRSRSVSVSLSFRSVSFFRDLNLEIPAASSNSTRLELSLSFKMSSTIASSMIA